MLHVDSNGANVYMLFYTSSFGIDTVTCGTCTNDAVRCSSLCTCMYMYVHVVRGNARHGHEMGSNRIVCLLNRTEFCKLRLPNLHTRTINDQQERRNKEDNDTSPQYVHTSPIYSLASYRIPITDIALATSNWRQILACSQHPIRVCHHIQYVARGLQCLQSLQVGNLGRGYCPPAT